jgi:hypothetical protein
MADQTFLDQFGPANFVNLAVARIPSTFEKLIFLTNLRDADSGRYRVPLAELAYGEQQIGAALLAEHQAVFLEWIGFDLAAQMAEVARYLAGQAGDRKSTVANWFYERSFEKFVPITATELERERFWHNMTTVLQLLQIKFSP